MKFFIILLLILLSCSENKPSLDQVKANDVEVFSVDLKAKELWISTTDYTAGTLSLYTKSSNNEFGLIKNLPITGDSKIVRQKNISDIFLLSRGSVDSVSFVNRKTADVSYELAFGNGFNPQDFYYFDKKAAVIGLDSNEVVVYQLENKSIVAKIDLSFFKDDVDQWVEPVSFIEIGTKQLGVLVARLKRTAQGWTPSEKSGLLIFDLLTLKPVFQDFIQISNPIGGNYSGNQLQIFGSGDFSMLGNSNGSVGTFNWDGVKLSTESIIQLEGKIISYKIHLDDLALVTWFPSEKKSCLTLNNEEILCEYDEEVGYTIGQVYWDGEYFIISQTAKQESTLSRLDINGRKLGSIKIKGILQGFLIPD